MLRSRLLLNGPFSRDVFYLNDRSFSLFFGDVDFVHEFNLSFFIELSSGFNQTDCRCVF